MADSATTSADPVVSRLLTFKELCKERLFKVPDYQRGYAWEPEQVQDLLSDIERIDASREYRHFTGTIVLADPESGRSQDHRLQVVDGQQRLTTLIMIVARLHRFRHLPEESRRYILTTYLEHGDPRRAEPVLMLNEATHEHFKSYVLEGRLDAPSPTMVSHRRLLDAIDCIDNWLSTAALEHVEILEKIDQRLGFIVFKPDSSDEVGLMFEMINNRGKSLSELEKIKNYLIYYSVKAEAPTLRQSIDDAWSKILADLSLADGLQRPDEHLFMRSACITYFGFRKTESNAAYNALKNSFPIDSSKEGWPEMMQFIDFLRDAAMHYRELRSDEDSARQRFHGRREVSDLLDRIGSQRSIASVLPCYLGVMALRDKGLIDDSQLVKMLSVIEKVNFRVYLAFGAARRSDSGQGRLFSVAHRVFRLCDNKTGEGHGPSTASITETFNGIIAELVQFALEYSSLKGFKSHFVLDEESPIDFGQWRSLKYFLMNYEQEFNKKKSIRIRDVNLTVDESRPDDFPSIEHILAQANRPVGMNHDKANWLKRRLGNFVLLELGVNKRARDKDIGDKVKIYDEVDGSQMRQVRQICKDYNRITSARSADEFRSDESEIESLIDGHEERLRDFAEKRWRLPGE